MEWKNNRKDQLAKALYDLLQDHNIQSISVQDIVDKAELSRRTFYNHFIDKFDLSNYILDKMAHEYSISVGDSFYDSLEVNNISDILSMFVYRNFFLNTLCYTGQNCLMDHLVENFNSIVIDELRRIHPEMEITDDIMATIVNYTYGSANVQYAMLRGIIPTPEKGVAYAKLCLPKVLYDLLYEK